MNFSTVKEKILQAILIAERVTGKKESLPILSCVLLDVSKELVIESKGTRTLIKSIPHDEFPALPGGAEGSGISISRMSLIQGIQAVSYAASPSMIRTELGSVYVSMHHNGLTCVATDSFRLAEKTIRGEKGTTQDILVPLKHA